MEKLAPLSWIRVANNSPDLSFSLDFVTVTFVLKKLFVFNVFNEPSFWFFWLLRSKSYFQKSFFLQRILNLTWFLLVFLSFHFFKSLSLVHLKSQVLYIVNRDSTLYFSQVATCVSQCHLLRIRFSPGN